MNQAAKRLTSVTSTPSLSLTPVITLVKQLRNGMLSTVEFERQRKMRTAVLIFRCRSNSTVDSIPFLNCLTKVITGVKLKDGVEVTDVNLFAA